MKIKGIHTIYDIAAEEFAIPEKKPSFIFLLLKASSIFVLVTLVVFSISNYEYIRSQLGDADEKEYVFNENK